MTLCSVQVKHILLASAQHSQWFTPAGRCAGEQSLQFFSVAHRPWLWVASVLVSFTELSPSLVQMQGPAQLFQKAMSSDPTFSPPAFGMAAATLREQKLQVGLFFTRGGGKKGMSCSHLSHLETPPSKHLLVGTRSSFLRWSLSPGGKR